MDATIVNPRRLSRDLKEAVCQQCHLHGDATVPNRGRHLGDFRPGLPLQDFRQDYWLEVDSRPMTVVGHVEQMHLSKCYQKSTTLTCTTCHDPHAFPRPEERVSYYQAICQKCHSCKEKEPARLRARPDNDCVQCHMPSSPTDVPHVSFTHHRIGFHARTPDQPAPQNAQPRVGTLRPVLANPRLGAMDQARSLGLAYLSLSQYGEERSLAPVYRQRAFGLLAQAYGGGLRGPVLEASLARLHLELGDPEAFPLARGALEHKDLVGVDRCKALFVLGAEHFKRQNFRQAAQAFRELVTLRRHPDDWLLLGRCEQALGNQTAAAQALQKAQRIKASPAESP